MSTALYVLAAEHRFAAENMANLNLPEDVIHDTLESLSGDLESKAVSIAKFARNLEAAAEQIKLAETQMANRRKSIETRAESIRGYLLNNLLHAGIQKIDCPYFKIAIRDNPPAIVIDDMQLIPTAYMTDPPPPAPLPDKKLIKKAIEDGFAVPGAHITRNKRLEIK